MPVTVMPNRAASRSGRQAGPSRSGRTASWAETMPDSRLLRIVKKLSTRMIRPTRLLPRTKPALTSCGTPLSRTAITICSTIATTTSTATVACHQRATTPAA